MYGVFESQLLPMKVAFARAGTDIEVAYTPDGEPDYLYQVGRLLAVDDPVVLRRLEGVLRGIRRAAPDEQPAIDGLVMLTIDDLERGHLKVPEAMDLIDEEFAKDKEAMAEEETPVSPVHVLDLKFEGRLCAATEPEVPCCGSARRPGEALDKPCPPCPPAATSGGEGLLIGICDTGLLQNLDFGQVSWLAGVDGDPDPLGPVLPGGARDIPKYTGHGTFVSGVARCEAPGAAVHVTRLFTKYGGEFEHVIAQRLTEIAGGQLTAGRTPDIVNLSAGGYTRKNRPPLSITLFYQRHPGFTLTAAAGNDATDRPFWPAAFPQAIAVGALGADQQHRAWFSNFGDWVDVYAPGDALVNAFATGVYTYQEPPRRPARQAFHGMARWSGTSFSAPLVAGLIAAWMSANAGVPAAAAAATLLGQAAADPVSGVGPVLYSRQ
jgi:hypothetical protein